MHAPPCRQPSLLPTCSGRSSVSIQAQRSVLSNRANLLGSPSRPYLDAAAGICATAQHGQFGIRCQGGHVSSPSVRASHMPLLLVKTNLKTKKCTTTRCSPSPQFLLRYNGHFQKQIGKKYVCVRVRVCRCSCISSLTHVILYFIASIRRPSPMTHDSAKNPEPYGMARAS